MYLLQHVYEVTTLTALVGIERYDCRCPLMSSIPTRIFTTLLTPHLTPRNPPVDRMSNRFSLTYSFTHMAHLGLYKTTDTSNKNSGTYQQTQPSAHILLSRKRGRGLAMFHRLRRSHRHIGSA